MAIDKKLLEMLASDDPQVRYVALDQLRDSKESSEAIVEALIKATHDEDKGTADRAVTALISDVHHKLALKMGTAELTQTADPAQGTLAPTTTPLSAVVDTPTTRLKKPEPIEIPLPVVVPDWLQTCQAVTFFFSALALITSIIESDSSEFLYGAGRIYIFVIIVYIGLQLYVIRKFGFKESLQFLGKLANIFSRRR
jgi:hypothetical protein